LSSCRLTARHRNGDDAVAPIVPGSAVSLTIASAPGWCAGGAMLDEFGE
jgi:hypothetical protein